MSSLNQTSVPHEKAEVRVAVKQRKQKKRSGALGRFIRRFLLVLFTLVILLAGGLAMMLNTVFNGPSETARDMLTVYLSEDSATEWVPGIFLGDEKVAEILSKSGAVLDEEG